MTRSFFNLKTLAIAVIAVFAIPIFAAEYIISNPYAGVDFSKQYKAGFHNHSTYSDGQDTRWDMIMDAYRKGFSIFTINDHNYVTPAWDVEGYEVVSSQTLAATSAYYKYYESRTNGRIYPEWKGLKKLTTEEKLAIEAGTHSILLQGTQISYRKEGQGGMIGLAYTNEQTSWWNDHINSYWADYNRTANPSANTGTLDAMAELLSEVQKRNGITILNHPGRGTGAGYPNREAYTLAPANSKSSQATWIEKYETLLRNSSSTFGIEIINKLDGESVSDRILWDNLLKKMMPERMVCGFSNDDAHSTGAVGYSYNLLLMPSGSELKDENVRKSMNDCAFFAFAHVAHRENVNQGVTETPQSDENLLQGSMPKVNNIIVSEQTITITAESVMPNGSVSNDPVTIEWIANGNIIHEGATFNLDAVSGKFENYVRANVKNSNGIIFVQPFGIEVIRSPEEDIVAAKTAIEAYIYTASEKRVTTATEAQTAIKNIIDGFRLNRVATQVIVSEKVDDGYPFVVKLSKEGITRETGNLKFTITQPKLTCELKSGVTKIAVGTSSTNLSRGNTWDVKCDNISLSAAPTSGFEWGATSFPPVTAVGYASIVANAGASTDCATMSVTCTVPVVPIFECVLKNPGTTVTIGDAINSSQMFNVYCNRNSSGSASASSTNFTNYTVTTPVTFNAAGLHSITIRSSGTNAANCSGLTVTCPAINVVNPLVCAATQIVAANECVARNENQCTGVSGIEWYNGTCMTNADVLLAKKEACDEYWTGVACVPVVSSCALATQTVVANECVARTETQCTGAGIEWYNNVCMTTEDALAAKPSFTCELANPSTTGTIGTAVSTTTTTSYSSSSGTWDVKCNGTLTSYLTWPSSSSRVPTEVGEFRLTATRPSSASSCAGMTAICTIPIVANLSGATVTVNGNYTYTGLAQIPAAENVVVVFNDKILEHDIDYIYAVANNINAGVATVTLTGKGYYTGTKTEDFVILSTPLIIATVSEFNPMIYTGIEQTPIATVTVNGLEATGTWSNVTNVADLTTFTANGNFTGTLEKETGMEKADGEAVAKPVLASVTLSNITIEALTTNNDQEVEYAISENESHEQLIFDILDILEFSGLKESSTYYIFARAKENANYKTGTISEPLEVTTQTNSSSSSEEAIVQIGDSSSSNEETSSSSDGESSSSSDDSPLPIHFSQVSAGNISAKAIGRAIVLENVPQGAKVRIYNLKGERIYNSQLSAFNSQLKIEVQTRGMYVAIIGSQTLRVLVK